MNPNNVPNIALIWAHGAVGSALPLQGRGHRFDSGCVHIIFLNWYTNLRISE